VDLSLEEVAKRASGWGFDGLEIACDPRHFDADLAAENDAYLEDRRAVLERHGLKCWAISPI